MSRAPRTQLTKYTVTLTNLTAYPIVAPIYISVQNVVCGRGSACSKSVQRRSESRKSRKSQTTLCLICDLEPAVYAGKCEGCRRSVNRYEDLTREQIAELKGRLLIKLHRLERAALGSDDAYLATRTDCPSGVPID